MPVNNNLPSEDIVVGPFHADIVNRFFEDTGSTRTVTVGDAVSYDIWSRAYRRYGEVKDKEPKGYPDNNPKTSVGATKLDLSLVPESAIICLAAAMKNGADKYGPFNWREHTISSMVYIAAVKRHVAAWVDGEDYADDSGVHHLDHAMACLALLRDAESIGKLNDNRPPKGAAARLLKEYADNTATATVGQRMYVKDSLC